MDSTSKDVNVQPARGECQHDNFHDSCTRNEHKKSIDVDAFKVQHQKPELVDASLRWVSIFNQRHFGPLWNEGEWEQQIRRKRRSMTFVSLVGACLLLLLLIGHDPPREVDKGWGRLSMLESIKPSRQARRRRLIEMNANESNKNHDRGVSTGGDKRLLYIITSSKDRFEEVVIPIILDAVDSFVQSDEYSVVDVYMIVSYTFSQKKMENIASLLPPGVGFQVWEDAMPMQYSCRKARLDGAECIGAGRKYVPADQGMLQVGGAQLARQHRYLVKDKLPYYDFFVVFEDDMRVTQTHVQNHQEIMTEINALRKRAPPTNPINMPHIRDPTAFLYDLSEPQLARIRPGLIRVEVLPKEKDTQRLQEELDPIAVSKTTIAMLLEKPNRDNSSSIDHLSAEELLDATPCCHTKHHAPTINNGNPTPNATELMTWEAGILGMSVRRVPSLGWVAMLPGPDKLGSKSVPGFEPIMYKGPNGDDSQSLDLKSHARAPILSSDPRYLAQSAGWIASPREIMEFHNSLCQGGFLPPFDHKNFPMDGLHRHNVEFWSGGIQLWCGSCNIQRILLLDPPYFSKHLIYHTANNKQMKIPQDRLVRVTDLMGQLYTIQQQASNVKMP